MRAADTGFSVAPAPPSSLYGSGAGARYPAWVQAVLFVVVALVTVAVGFGSGRPTSQALAKSGAMAASAPPGVVFAVVWAALYALSGCAMVFQGLAATTPAHWVSLALLGAVVVVCFAWPTIWVRAAQGALPFGAPSWTIAALLIAGGTGLALVPSATNAALWAPLLLWLVFALGLCLQGQARPIQVKY